MLDDLRYRLRALFRRNAVERELDEELRFHLDQQAAMDERAGADPVEARRQARLALGGLEATKEATRDARGVRILEILGRDLRYGLRTLVRTPVFTIVAVASLALGIGANTAMFQLLNALVLRPVPVARPHELVEVRLPDRDLDKARGAIYRYPSVTNALWEALRARQQAFDAFAWADDDFNLAPVGEVRNVSGLFVSGELFPVLGLTPAAGRLFGPADDRRGCGLTGAVISHDFWQREFGGSPAAIGRALSVDAHTVPIIGVAPAGFTGLQVGRRFDVAVPVCSVDVLRQSQRMLESGTTWWLTVMGRLRPDWTVARADAHIRTLAPAIFRATLHADYPAVSVPDYLGSGLETMGAATGRSGLREEYEAPLTLLLAMTALVLLIACTNLTNLMLARGAVRRRELSLRLAIGASRARLVSQLLAESVLIVGASAVAALVIAQLTGRALVRLIGSSQRPIALSLESDWRVLGFVAVSAVTTCLLLGLAPALRATRRQPGEAMRAAPRGASEDPGGLALRRGLIVAQVAVSLVLVVGALLFARSFQNLVTEPLGFDRQGVLVVDAGLPNRPSPEAAAALRQALAASLRAVPGVVAVSQTNVVPLSGNTNNNRIWRDGGTRAGGQDAFFSRISPGYLDTLEMRLVAGRDVADTDGPEAPKVAIVNETFARGFSPGASPIGQHFWIEATPGRPEMRVEIVGVVKDAKYRRVREAPAPVVYLALAQHQPGASWLVRANVPASALTEAVRAALLRVDGRLRFVFRPLDAAIDDTLLRDRALALLSSLFGLLAALLAAVGLHGVIAYAVERRRREIGIRLALGASRGAIAASVLRESGWLVAAGLVLGLALTWVTTGAARTLLFGLGPHDVATVAAALGGLAAVALGATLFPARRAARVDPMTTLKDD
jgi:putative ABC transport system permease protein